MVEAKDSFKRSLRIEFDAYGIIIIKRASLLISWMTNDHLFFKISSLSFCPHYLDSTRMFLHASLWLVSCIQTCVFSLQAQASSIVFFYPADRNNADREKKKWINLIQDDLYIIWVRKDSGWLETSCTQ